MQALRDLGHHSRIKVSKVSSLYETEPQDLHEQPWFLNIVIAVTTDLDPQELLVALQEVERAAGRVRFDQIPRGPRTLDIDILLFGASTIDTPTLKIPHPGMLHRRFVLEPLLEIAPEVKLPGTEEKLSTYLWQLREAPSQDVRVIKTQMS